MMGKRRETLTQGCSMDLEGAQGDDQVEKGASSFECRDHDLMTPPLRDYSEA